MKIFRVLLALASVFVVSLSPAATFTEDFSRDPLTNGWHVFGDTNLFHWNATNQNVEVIWDSTQTNSYFAHPLGTTLALEDAFTVSFELQVSNAVAFNYGSELAVGLCQWSEVTNSTYSRSGVNSPDLFEFDYFPDTGFGDSMDATLIDASNDFYFAYDNLTLHPGVTYEITLTHAAGSPSIAGQVLADGLPYSTFANIYTEPGQPITDFRLDTLAISSYQDDGFGDDILAKGTLTYFTLTLPPPPVQDLSGYFTNGVWAVSVKTRTNWSYTLERSTDLRTWKSVTPATAGTSTNLLLLDHTPPSTNSCYRISAQRP